jgi:hypothetical protein
MEITFHSLDLYREVREVVSGIGQSVDGLLLLRYYDRLVWRMETLQTSEMREIERTSVIAELSLLMQGFLDDDETFASFGFQTLYQQKCISLERWRRFTASRARYDLNTIEKEVEAIDEADVLRRKRRQAFLESLRPDRSDQQCHQALSANWQIDDSTLGSGNCYDSGLKNYWSDAWSGPVLDESETHKLLESLLSSSPATDQSPLLRQDGNSGLSSPLPEISAREEVAKYWNSFGITTAIIEQSDPAPWALWERVAALGIRIGEEPSTTAEIPELQLCCEALRKRLQGIHSSLEHALLASIRNGNSSRVEEILSSSERFREKSCQKTITLLDDDMLNKELEGDFSRIFLSMTCLMVAALSSNLRIVQALLRYGFDVNVLTSRGSALSVAAEVNAKPIIQLLLQNGADLPDAIFALSVLVPEITNDKTKARLLRAAQRLEKIATETSEDLLPGPQTEREKHFRQLHFEFSSQHAHLLDTADKYASENAQSGWSASIERLRRRSWKVGMRVLRKLVRGQLPKTVSEIIIFLVVVKCMSAVIDCHESGVSNHGRAFYSDLSRWQLLFKEQDESLRDFQCAITSIWGIALEPPACDAQVDNEVLRQFQLMALDMLETLSSILELDGSEEPGNGGLLLSQKRWHRKLQDSHISPGGHGKGRCLDPGDIPIDDPPDYQERDLVAVSGRLPMMCQHSGRNIDPVFLIIIAGAIFGIVILFQLGISQFKSILHRPQCANVLHILVFRYLLFQDSPGQNSPLPQSQPSLQEPVLRSGLQHMVNILRYEVPLSEEFIAEMKLNVELNISAGQLPTFSSLIECALSQCWVRY